MREFRFDIATGVGQTYTGTATRGVVGKLYAVKLKIGTLAATTDVTLTVTQTPDAVDITLLTLTDVSDNATYYPRHQVHNNEGTLLTLDGTRIAYDRPLVNGFLKVAVAQGGASKAGVLLVYVES